VLVGVAEHPRRPGRYTVRLGDGRAFLVDTEAVGALPSLCEGTALDGAAVLALERSASFVASLDRAMRALARARRSRRELAMRLARSEPDGDVVSRVLDRLATLGLLDDGAVARAEAASRFRRGEGAGRVRQALARKGIDGALVDAAVREVSAEESVDEDALCRSAAEKRLRALRAQPADVQRRRLTGFLLRRGFAGSVVHATVRQLLRRGWEDDA
jgi:regulatory protein